MNKKLKSPEEFGLTDKNFYDDPEIAAQYWAQFPPSEALPHIVIHARTPLAALRMRVDVLLRLGEGKVGEKSIQEFMEPTLAAIDELNNFLSTIQTYGARYKESEPE